MLSTLLRFAHSEQLGLAVLFLLVLAMLLLPRFCMPPEPDPFVFESLQRRIDTAVSPTLTHTTARLNKSDTGRRTMIKPTGPATATPTQGGISYKPFVSPTSVPVLVDLNRADTTELKQVRGIGSYYARRIVEYRERLGGYVDIGQLLEIRGIDEERVLRWQKELKVDLGVVRKIDLLNTPEEDLRKHPYIGFYAARGIVSFRKIQTVISLDGLVKNNVLSDDAAERLQAYVAQ